MKTSTLSLTLLCSLFLSGCSQYVWVKPMGDPATFNADHYNCKQSAMTSAPPVFQVYHPYARSYDDERLYTHCKDYGDREVCKTRMIGSPHVAPPPHTVDLNARNRTDLYNACMGAQGWVLQEVKDPQ